MLRSLLAVLIALVLCGQAGPGHAQDATPGASPVADCPATTEEQNAAIARRWHEDAVNGHDLAVLDEILAPDAPQDSATFADNPGPRQVLGALFTGFPDVQHTVDTVITDGDLVVVRYTASGTHGGEFQGYAPTGKTVTWTGINIYRIECGRIAETWSEVDGLGRIAQMTGGEAGPSSAATPTP
ncbi:MAG: ester cyclase [Thermomicrobiales bacterium]